MSSSITNRPEDDLDVGPSGYLGVEGHLVAQVIEDALVVARQARSASHAPYSAFAMGASVVGADGSIVVGCLVESISLGLAMCAERVAVFSAVARSVTPISVVALVARRTAGSVTTPCGACLQVIAEHATEDCLVVCEDTRGGQVRYRLAELAPQLPLPRR